MKEKNSGKKTNEWRVWREYSFFTLSLSIFLSLSLSLSLCCSSIPSFHSDSNSATFWISSFLSLSLSLEERGKLSNWCTCYKLYHQLLFLSFSLTLPIFLFLSHSFFLSISSPNFLILFWKRKSKLRQKKKCVRNDIKAGRRNFFLISLSSFLPVVFIRSRLDNWFNWSNQFTGSPSFSFRLFLYFFKGGKRKGERERAEKMKRMWEWGRKVDVSNEDEKKWILTSLRSSLSLSFSFFFLSFSLLSFCVNPKELDWRRRRVG